MKEKTPKEVRLAPNLMGLRAFLFPPKYYKTSLPSITVTHRAAWIVMTDFKYKTILCGAAAVGKTALIKRFVSNQFVNSYVLTIGVEVTSKIIELASGNSVTLSIWDVAGQERFKEIRPTFYKGAVGGLVVFDLTRNDTYEEATHEWLGELQQFINPSVPFVLIGNKLDLVAEVGSAVDRDAARAFAEDHGSIYIETSALDGTMVDEAFVELIDRILTQQIG
ncbi:MAG TPA: Rab family GTPase [Candidatus Lokiarchaeia archaeon]|nr:Rab family GTPase [Candidatus Lokiarchaeia archaeon]